VHIDTDNAPTRPSRDRIGTRQLIKLCAVLVAAGLAVAACGSSGNPSASKAANKKSGTNHAAGTTTTTIATAAGSTTSTTAGASGSNTTTTVKSGTKAPVTTTTVKAAVSSTPGGSLSSNLTSTPSAALTGVGSSSISPFYGRVLYQYNKDNPGVTVNYSPTGSGPGVTAVEQNTASFGQSEVPMTSAQQAASKGPVLQVPVDLGGVAVSYNESCASGLQLSGSQLAQIYLRQITNWNQLASNCPSSDSIIPVFRSDTSGPGYDLDQYLIDTSPAWVSAIGTSSPSTTWPSAGRSGGSGEDLNAGVATYIQETAGAIGYVEYAYALQANFANAALQDQAGGYVSPSVTTIGNAGAAKSNVSASNFNIIDGAGSNVYPLANFSWALIYQKQSSTNTGIVLGKLFQWILTAGQSYSAGLGYAPLPADVVASAHATLLGLQTASGQAIFTN
jgi:phosphate transport system substrate-binding protein